MTSASAGQEQEEEHAHEHEQQEQQAQQREQNEKVHEQQHKDGREVTLKLVCRKPLMYTCDGFLSALECEHILSIKAEERRHGNKTYSQPDDPLVRDISRRIGAITGTKPHESETAMERNWTPVTIEIDEVLPNGLHVDTNNDRPFRFATALIYLNELGSGFTVFPAAVNAEEEMNSGVEAAEQLLDQNILHTCSALASNNKAVHLAATRLLSTAETLLSASNDKKEGIYIQPKQGSLLLFYSRDDDGEMDAHSWHGGSAVWPNEDLQFDGKFTLQQFKEVPMPIAKSQIECAKYIRKKRSLKEAMYGDVHYEFDSGL